MRQGLSQVPWDVLRALCYTAASEIMNKIKLFGNLDGGCVSPGS